MANFTSALIEEDRSKHTLLPLMFNSRCGGVVRWRALQYDVVGGECLKAAGRKKLMEDTFIPIFILGLIWMYGVPTLIIDCSTTQA